MGGQQEGTKFKGIYKNTLGYYFALFGQNPPKHIWEPTDERFSPEIFGCAVINIQRVAAFILNETRQPMQRYYFMNTLRRKRL